MSRTDWVFTKEEITNTPSRADGIERPNELQYRQYAASFINECGLKLILPRQTICTGIVLMHRFYMLHLECPNNI